MRILIAAAPAALLVLAGCATGLDGSRYDDELQRLTADCHARGGILSPTGQQSGRPQLDNVCKISGVPSPMTRN